MLNINAPFQISIMKLHLHNRLNRDVKFECALAYTVHVHVCVYMDVKQYTHIIIFLMSLVDASLQVVHTEGAPRWCPNIPHLIMFDYIFKDVHVYVHVV